MIDKRVRGLKATAQLRELGLPPLLSRHSLFNGCGPYSAYKMRGATLWRKFAASLPEIEESMCRWEALNPEAYRDLPWYEDREEFKRVKARGEVVWPEWWELCGALGKVTHVVGTLKYRPRGLPAGRKRKVKAEQSSR